MEGKTQQLRLLHKEGIIYLLNLFNSSLSNSDLFSFIITLFVFEIVKYLLTNTWYSVRWVCTCICVCPTCRSDYQPNFSINGLLVRKPTKSSSGMQVPIEQKRSSTEPSAPRPKWLRDVQVMGPHQQGVTEGMAMGAEERRLWRQELDQRAIGISRNCLQLWRASQKPLRNVLVTSNRKKRPPIGKLWIKQFQENESDGDIPGLDGPPPLVAPHAFLCLPSLSPWANWDYVCVDVLKENRILYTWLK